MKPNPFAEPYKTISDIKLLDILAHQEDYQALAIEAAKQELANRQLSEEQIAQATEIIAINHQHQAQREKRQKAVKEKTKDVLSSIDPFAKRSPERSVRVISVVMGAVALFGLISNYPHFSYLFHQGEFDFLLTLDCFLLPVTVVLFGLKMRSGYILLNLWLIYKIAGSLFLWYYLFDYSGKEISVLFTHPPNTNDLLLYFLFPLTGLFIYINTKKIRTLFNGKVSSATSDSIILREALSKDIPQIQIVRNAVKENRLSNPGRVTDEDCSTFLFQRGKGWVCEIDKRIVGFAIVDLQEHNVWALFMHPDFEGRDIGRQLHEWMLDWYFSKTQQTLWLSTAPHTRAESFYRKSGWTETGLHGKGELKFEMTFEKWQQVR